MGCGVWGGVENIHQIFVVFKGAVSRFYHDFERFKNTPRSYIGR